MAPGIFPKSPGCRPCRHDTQCRCTRLCCVPFRFADMMIYLGCTPSGMRIATGMRPRSPQPRHGDLPEDRRTVSHHCGVHATAVPSQFAMEMRRGPPQSAFHRCGVPGMAIASPIAMAICPWRIPVGMDPSVCVPSSSLQQAACPMAPGNFPQISRLPVVATAYDDVALACAVSPPVFSPWRPA